MNEINHTSERVNTEKRTEKQIIMQKYLIGLYFLCYLHLSVLRLGVN